MAASNSGGLLAGLGDPDKAPLVLGLLSGLAGLGSGVARGGGPAGMMTLQGIQGGMQTGQAFGDMGRQQDMRAAFGPTPDEALNPRQLQIRQSMPAEFRGLAMAGGPQAAVDAYKQRLGRNPNVTWQVLQPEEAAQVGLPASHRWQRSSTGEYKPAYAPPEILQPGVEDARTRIAAAGASRVSTTIQNVADRAAVQADADVLRDLNRSLMQGQAIRGTIGALRELNTRTPEGAGAQWAPAAAQIGRTFGIDIPGGSEAEAFQALGSQLQALSRVPGTGDMNRQEVQNLVARIPQLSQTRQGREMILQTYEGILQNQERAAQIWRRNLGAPDLYERLNDPAQGPRPPGPAIQPPPTTGGPQAPPVNPLGAALGQQPPLRLPGAQPPPPADVPPPASTTNLPRVATPQDALRLPPGTRFLMPDGRVGTVPGAPPR